MELGESLEEVAAREMVKETVLTPVASTFSGCYKDPHGNEVHNVVTAYICTSFTGTLAHDEHEAYDVQFFDLDALPPNSSPPYMYVITHYKQRI